MRIAVLPALRYSPAEMQADAIVVLGCTLHGDGRPSRALDRRLALGARCYTEGLAPWVIASGGRRWAGRWEAVAMRERLLSLGVAAEALTMELGSLTTRDNCRYLAAALRARGGRQVVVATCGWHLPRAMAGLSRVGLEPVAPPTGWLDTPPPSTMLRARERLSAWIDASIARISPPAAS